MIRSFFARLVIGAWQTFGHRTVAALAIVRHLSYPCWKVVRSSPQSRVSLTQRVRSG
jgi:hypothetical protein